MPPPSRKALLVAALAAFIVVAGCSSSSPSPGGGSSDSGADGASCVLNSDCNSPLVCKLQRCHEQCMQSRECPSGERCILVDGNGVCQLPPETSCASGSCSGTLVCGPDQQCRAPCQNGPTDCPVGQVCAGGLCYDAAGDAGTTGDASSD